MIHITDFNGDIIDFISESDGAVTEAEHMINVEDKLETFDFTVLTSLTEHMQKRNRVIIEDKDGQYREFIIYNISSDLNGYTRVQTNSSALEDIKTARPVPPHKLDKHTVKQALEYALSDTGWEVSDEAEWGGTRTTSWTGWHDRISILKQLETTYGMRLSFYVEVGSNKITNRYVSLNKVEPMFNGEEIVYGDNMIDLKRTVDFSDIATALICLGPEDSETGKREIVEIKDDDAQAQFGLPYRYIWDIYEPESSDENMTRQRLTTLGRTALNKRKQESISYEIEGIGLSASAGDMIRVKNEDFTPELYVDAEVVEVTTDLISGESNYKFGVIKEYTRDDVYARFNAMLSGLRERLNKVVENTDSIISERLEEELKYVERYIEKSPTPPLKPKEGQLWLDTSHDGVAVLKRYENGEWVKSSVSNVKDIGGMTREETMYEALKERLVRNEVDYSEVFKRHGALVSEKHYHYVDEDIKNDLTSRYNSLQQSYDDFKLAFNNINTEQPTIGLITTAISRAIEFEARLKEYNDSYYVARKSFDEVIALLQSQYSDEKWEEAMQGVADSIGGVWDGKEIIADIPNKEDLVELNKEIKKYLDGEIETLDEVLGKKIETVITNATDEFGIAIESVEKKVDGIEIGGRNLVRNSEKITEYIILPKVEKAGTYTLSFEPHFTDVIPDKFGVFYGKAIDYVKNDKPRITHTFKVGEDRIGKDIRLFFGGEYLTHRDYVDKGYIAKVKLEYGNVATDWTPAPEDIENKVTTINETVSKNSSSISVLEKDIKLKVDNTTVDKKLTDALEPIQTNVQQNTAELGVQANEISQKVSSTKYTTDQKNNVKRFEQNEGKISTLEKEIKLKVTETDVQNKIDELEIGGRNLIPDSNQRIDKPVGTNYATIPNFTFKETGTYTIGFNATVTTDENSFNRHLIYVGRSVGYAPRVENGRTYATFTIEERDLNKYMFLYLGESAGISRENGGYFDLIKIEKGSKATDWSPAPEDMDERVKKAEGSITVNSDAINQRVSYTEINKTNKTLERVISELLVDTRGISYTYDHNGLLQGFSLNRNYFKLNHNLIDINNGDVIIKDGKTTVKDLSFDKLSGGTARFGGKDYNGTLEVLDKDDNPIMKLDYEQAVASMLNVGEINAEVINSGSVVSVLNIDRRYLVKSATSFPSEPRLRNIEVLEGTTNDDDEANEPQLREIWESSSLKAVFEHLPKHINSNVTVDIWDGGTEAELVDIGGFGGNSRSLLDIVFWDDKDYYYNFRLRSNSIPIRITTKNANSQPTIYSSSDNGSSGIEIYDCIFTIVKNLRLNGNNQVTRGLQVMHGSNVYVTNTIVENFNIGLRCVEMGRTYATDLRGANNQYGVQLHTGAILSGNGTAPNSAPTGKVNNLTSTSGGYIWGNWNFTNTGTTTPKAPSKPKQTTKKWTTSTAKVFYRNYGNTFTVSYMPDFPIQGNWGDSWGFRDGAWYFGTAMRNTLRGKTIKRVRVSIGRSAHNMQGLTGSRTFSLRLHKTANRPAMSNNTNPTFSSQVFRGSLAFGERKWFDVTSTFASALSSGDWYGFGVKTDYNNRAEYMAMMKSITVEVTYE